MPQYNWQRNRATVTADPAPPVKRDYTALIPLIVIILGTLCMVVGTEHLWGVWAAVFTFGVVVAIIGLALSYTRD